MKKFKRILIWCTVIIIVLLSATYFFAPKLINSELLKGKIETIASQKVKGDVQFQSLNLSIFPRPHLIIHQGSISTTEAIGTVGSLSIYPELLPLLTGKLQIRKLLVKSSDIQMSISPEVKKTKTTGTVRLTEISKKVATFLAAPLVLDHPDLVVVMENGNLNIIKESASVFSMENIDSEVVFPPKGRTVIKAKIASSIFAISAQYDNKDLVLKGSSLKGDVYHDKDKTSVSLTEFIVDYPDLSIIGKFVMDTKSDQISLELEGRDVDVYSTREVVLALAGNIPITQKIFKIVKGGNIPSITFNSKGNSFADLKSLKNMVIKGSMSEGEIFIPKVSLDLKAVKGDAVISDGILQGKNLEARLENAKGTEGILKLGFKGKDKPFHLEMNLDVDLSEAPPLLTRLVKNDNFVNEINRTRNVKGKARGRMILGESLKSIRTIVDVTEINMSAQYDRIPYNLAINDGQFFYDKTKVGVKNLSGKVGKSSFSDLALNIKLGEAPLLEIEHAKSIIILDEIYPWLMSYEKLRNGLKNIKFAEGRFKVSELNLKGPLLNPDDWHYTAKGSIERFVFDTSLSHGPVTVKQGKLEADEKALNVT